MIYHFFYLVFKRFFKVPECYMPHHLKMKEDWKCYDCKCGKK